MWSVRSSSRLLALPLSQSPEPNRGGGIEHHPVAGKVTQFKPLRNLIPWILAGGVNEEPEVYKCVDHHSSCGCSQPFGRFHDQVFRVRLGPLWHGAINQHHQWNPERKDPDVEHEHRAASWRIEVHPAEGMANETEHKSHCSHNDGQKVKLDATVPSLG